MKLKFFNLSRPKKPNYSELKTRIQEMSRNAKAGLRQLKYEQVLAAFQRAFVEPAYGSYVKPALYFLAIYLVADTVSLFGDFLVPDPPYVPPPLAIYTKPQQSQNQAAVDAIIRRNIFNSRGIIPTEELLSGIPHKTNLPLELIGVMVFENELNSIATIEDKSLNKIFPVQVDDVINGNLQIARIDERRVYFNDVNTGSFEFVELPEEQHGLDIGVQTLSALNKGEVGVAQTAPGQFEVSRATIDKSLSNMADVLRQARAIPNFENGSPDGFRIMEIVPGSIYDQLGIKNGDVLTSFNGEAMSDPSKAIQMLNDIKSANTSQAAITIRRNGQTMTMNYSIR